MKSIPERGEWLVIRENYYIINPHVGFEAGLQIMKTINKLFLILQFKQSLGLNNNFTLAYDFV